MTNRSLWVCLILAVALFFVSAAVLNAQTATGQVNGTVTDTSAAVIPNANVTLQNLATNIEHRTTTNASGNFTFLNVPPGAYALWVESAGFRTSRLASFTVGVNQVLQQDIALSLGQISESVVVTAESEMVQRASSELGTIITEAAVRELPLNGRNFTQLLMLTPGATPVNTSQGGSVTFQDAGPSGIPNTAITKPSLHGQQNRSTLYFMDGFVNTDLRGPIYGILPIVDLIEEFKVQSHNDKAENGGVTGGVVNVVSKSGTNQFHGAAWEFLRNDLLDARNSFTDPVAPAPFRQNEFGAALGGPIIRNRTFFYGGYEGWRYRRPSQSLNLVPTLEELNGNFSRSKINQNIFDPFSTRRDASGNFVRDAFPNNVIPSSALSPAMQGFLKAYLQAPNFAGDPVLNYIENFSTKDDSNNWQVKVDHRFRDADSVFFRWSQMRVSHVDPAPGVKATRPSDYTGDNLGGGWIHVFRPDLILDVRAGGLSKPFVFNQAKAIDGIDPMKQLGFKGVDQWGGLFVNVAAPWITTDIGNRGDSKRRNPDWSATGNVNWIKGNHNLRTGYQYIWVARQQINLFQQFVFTNQQTANPLAQGNTGASLASALVGLPSTYTGQLPDYGEVHFGLATWSAYVQDEWKVRPKLTVNYGLRFDALTQPKNIGTDRLSNAIDIANQKWILGATTMPPVCSQTNQNPCLPTDISRIPFGDRIVLAGEKYFMPKAVYDNWGPRIGAAYQLTPNTVIRGGYGLYWDALPARSQYAQNDIEAASWPWTTGFSGSANAIGSPLRLITEIEGSFPAPVPAATPWATISNSSYADDPNYKDGYSQQWNFEIQRQLTRDWMGSAAYVGSVNGRLSYTGYANGATKASPNGTSNAVIDSLRPMPFMPAIVHYTRSIGSSSYNSLQMRGQRRFANGWQTIVSYTWSKSLDNSSGYFGVEDGAGQRGVQNFFDPDSNRSVSGYDVPHFLSWFTLYEFPVGKGRRWLQSGPGAWALGGWKLNSIVSVRSGQAFTPAVNGDTANIGGTGPQLSSYARPNIVGDPIPAQQTANLWFNPSAFAIPVGMFGTAGRNILRSSQVWNVDFSVIKKTPLGRWEGKDMELRLEAFNLFNHVNLGVPATTIGQSNAGRVTSQVIAPRQLQLALKFNF